MQICGRSGAVPICAAGQGQEGGKREKEGGSGRVRACQMNRPAQGGPVGRSPQPEQQEAALAPPGPLLPGWVLNLSESFCWTWKVYQCMWNRVYLYVWREVF